MPNLVDTRKAGKPGTTLLFSTDIELDAQLSGQYYQTRFQGATFGCL
ncbi:hypothetical protein J5X98_12405 [Leptothermofonsia sichuanensis E412]|nr:hypothetical protein [Leptothermofonsia sichuanensis]QZZ23062.1 hypothetical protein J5X98_12405 [Leptothermofonsia sichuanensis E412]